MKIALCGSIDHYKQIGEIAEELRGLGHEFLFPDSVERILKGEVDHAAVNAYKSNFGEEARQRKYKIMMAHMDKIKSSDAILVCNFEKKGTPNYIGGNTFLEMGGAMIYKKKIFIYNPIPEIGYKDEISGMLPIIINGDLKRIK
jgi:hypothetical protein